MENNWLPIHASILCNTRCSIVQKSSIKQNTKVICRFDRLRIAHSKRQTSHMCIRNLSATHTFDYIVLRIKPGLTSCEDLAMALPGAWLLCDGMPQAHLIVLLASVWLINCYNRWQWSRWNNKWNCYSTAIVRFAM